MGLKHLSFSFYNFWFEGLKSDQNGIETNLEGMLDMTPKQRRVKIRPKWD